MRENAIVEFLNCNEMQMKEIEVPLYISANDLVLALNEAFNLNINIEDSTDCYLISENPIAFLKGEKSLYEYGIRNGSLIIFKRENYGLSI